MTVGACVLFVCVCVCAHVCLCALHVFSRECSSQLLQSNALCVVMLCCTAAAASPVVKSPVSRTSLSPPAVKKVRVLNAPTLVTVVDLSEVQLLSVDDSVVCVECQKPMNTAEHYKFVIVVLTSLSISLFTSLTVLIQQRLTYKRHSLRPVGDLETCCHL